MNRRQALTAMINAMGLAGASSVFGAQVFAEQVTSDVLRPVLGSDELRVLEEVAETILPATDSSPGARDAGIADFFQEMVSTYYTFEQQRIFLEGLQSFQQLTQASLHMSFSELSAAQRESLLLTLEAKPDVIYYQMIKQLTLWGYFSSEVGVKQALRFTPIPGRYDGQVKIEPGAKAWANIGA